jgi:hypothetical protein
MNMRCKEIRHKLIDYYENSLLPEERRLVQEHLDVCLNCQRELEKLSATFELLKKESSFKPEEHYWTNFVPGVRSKIEKGRETTVVIIPKWKIAGGIITFFLILILGVFLLKQDRKVMFRSGEETYTYLSPTESENIVELLYAEEDYESSLDYLFTDKEKRKLAMLEEALEKGYWDKGGKEKALEELKLEELENLKVNLEKIKFKKEIL